MKMRWKALAGVAAAVALVIAPLTASAASAHTSDFTAKAACDKTTGTYTVTYKLELDDVPSGRVGSTKWRIGDSSFDGTPRNANGMDKGPVGSVGSQTVVLGTQILPGNTVGNGPWVYAYTTWKDGHNNTIGRGSDGRVTGLDGKCAKNIPAQPTPKKDVTSDCTAPGHRTVTHTETAYVWDAAKAAWVLGQPVVTHESTFYDVTCVVVVTPEPPVWTDPCGPGNGYWSFPSNPEGYRYETYSEHGYRIVAILPSLLDGYLIKPGSKLIYAEKDSNEACPAVVIPASPIVKDLCDTADDHYGLPAETTGIVYSRDGLDIVATLVPGSTFGDLPAGWTLNQDGTATYAFNAEQFTDIPCDETEETAVPALFDAAPTGPTCDVAGGLPSGLSAGEFANVTLAIEDGDVAGSWVLTVTPKSGFHLGGLNEAWTINEDGTATRTIVADPALGYQSEDSEAPCFQTPPEQELIPGEIASQCVGSVPYLGYAVGLPEGFEAGSATPLTITFVHPTDPTQNYNVANLPLSGTLLWPGATAGTPQQWPGWVLMPDGTYAETDGNYAWTRAAAGITVRFDVNPTFETVVTYPPESALCANPAPASASTPATAALPATGGVDMTPWGISAAVMLLAGAALLVTRRVARR